MATAKPNISGSPRRGKGRLILWGGLLAVALLAWFWKPLHSHARAAAAESARLVCPCRFVAGRGMDSCRRDIPGGIGPVFLSEDTEEKGVTALVPLLSSQTATYREGLGCVLEPWEN